MKKLPLLLFVFAILMLLAVAWRSPFAARSSASQLNDSMARHARTGADEATLAARDASQRLVQVTVRNAGDREAAQELGTIIEDYGSFAVVSMDREKAAQALQENHDLAAIETTVSLRGITFEPLEENSAKAFGISSGKGLSKAETGGDYYIVQFAAPVRDEWLEEIRAAGGDVIQYVPNQAFFVFATAEAMATIAQHPRVRWTGAFRPADNISPQMRALTATRRNLSAATGAQKGLFDISVFKNKDLDAVAKAALDFGATVRNKIVLPNNYFNVLRVEMEPGLSLPVLQISGVISIDPYTPPMREDERAAQVLAGNFIGTTQLSLPGYNSLEQFGVDGAGVTVSVVDDGVGIPGDGGFYITSGNAVNGPLRGAPAGAEGHGHLNATIVAGDSPFSVLDPLGYNYGLGVARKAHIVNIPLLRTGYTGTEADTCNDTVTTAGPNGIKGFISNNSWGAGTNGNAYDSYAAQYDGFVRDSSAAAAIDPLLIVFSAGNQGAIGLTRPKVAKNLIAVANSDNIRTELSSSANNIDDLNSSSSRGPAADGRIKPDITAPGTAISGGRSGTDVLFGNIDSVHRWSSGTSHAAPQIAGAAALFTQFWKNNNAGVNPSPALVKAALINGTQEMNGVGTSATIPNGAEGWGRLNLQNVLNTGVATKYVNETSTLSSVGSEVTFTGAVASFTRQFRVSLVWTDPPGTVDPALVNNLDLEVTVGATTYKGNVFSNGLSASGGSADIRNNVENVFLPAGLPPGTAVTIRIRATGLNGDGALGNGDPTDQHFALVAFNFAEGAVPQPRAVKDDFDGDGKTDLSVWRGALSSWLIVRSSNASLQTALWGASFAPYNDIAVPGDYDGDGKYDVAVWRPLDGNWYIVRSSDGVSFTTQGGGPGTTPVPGDYDGDGKTDVAYWNGATTVWTILRSSDGQTQTMTWGASYAPYFDIPVPADYDGDHKTDIAIFRRQTGHWYIVRSSDSVIQTQYWGLGTDITVPGDYDGDGKADIAVWRGSDSNWYIIKSSDSQTIIRAWGADYAPYFDVPVPGDYDGDGKTDIAVWRPLDGGWYVIRSSNNQAFAQLHGQGGDTPVPATGVR
jgi:hypothetical protein